MYIAHLATIEQNISGSVKIFPDSRSIFREGLGRVSRTGTLDGSCVLVANGFSVADLTITLRARNVTRDVCNQLWDLHQSETTFTLACIAGHFFGAVSSMKVDGGDIKIVFKVKSEDSS